MVLKPFTRKINYYETDKMQVVHHSNYIRFLEECRMDFLAQVGLDYDEMERRGIMIPVLSVSCDYKVPVRFGDTICILPKIESFSGVKFKVSYKICSSDMQVLHNEATSEHCFLDFDFKPLRMKKEFPDIYEKMTEIAGKDLFE